jgi:thimet oligopeptidase
LIRSPAVLSTFARDYKSGKPIPAELVTRMNRAESFRRAIFVSRNNAFAALSYDVFKTKPENVDVDKAESADTRRYTTIAPMPGEHFYASFDHLAGYSSAYYTYMWDKVIAIDFYSQFDTGSAFAGDTPMRYRRLVLEPGGSMSANDLVKSFLGRPQNTVAFKRWLSQEFEDSPAQFKRTSENANQAK